MGANEKVVEFAEDKNGQIVRSSARTKGDEAECWDLAEMALTNSNSKTSWEYFQEEAKKKKLKPSAFASKDYDYVWGKPVDDVGSIMPGDIIQFRDHTQKYDAKYEFHIDGGGGTYKESGSQKRGPQPTAIVVTNQGKGHFTVLEQHVMRPKPDRSNVVGRGFVYLKSGTVPLKSGASEKITPAWATQMRGMMFTPDGKKFVDSIQKKHTGFIKVTAEVTITVGGSFKVYRPQPRQ